MAHIQSKYAKLWKPEFGTDKISYQRMFQQNIDQQENNYIGLVQSLNKPQLTKATLKAINTSDETLFTSGMLISVLENRYVYQFNRTSTATDDNDSVIAPTTGGGRWLSISSYIAINAIPKTEKGAASGVAPLNADTKIPMQYAITNVADGLLALNSSVKVSNTYLTDASLATKGIVQLSNTIDNSNTTATTPNAVNTVINNLITSIGDDYAPKAHAITGTTYGSGNATLYGHLRLSTSVNSSSDANGGYAATPSAVKSAYDLASNINDRAILPEGNRSSGFNTLIQNRISQMANVTDGSGPINGVGFALALTLNSNASSGTGLGNHGSQLAMGDSYVFWRYRNQSQSDFSNSNWNQLLTAGFAETVTGQKTFTTIPISTATPTSATHIVNKAYADTKLSLAGGSITGNVAISGGATLRIGDSSTYTTYTYANGGAVIVARTPSQSSRMELKPDAAMWVVDETASIAYNIHTQKSFPKNHYSTGTDYGIGNAAGYGHLKLSDSVDNSGWNSSSGYACSVAAVTRVEGGSLVPLNNNIDNLATLNTLVRTGAGRITAYASGTLPGYGVMQNVNSHGKYAGSYTAQTIWPCDGTLNAYYRYTNDLSTTGWSSFSRIAMSSASSREVKKNIEYDGISDIALEFINAIDPVTFRYKADDSKINFGYIAEEVEDVLNRLGLSDFDGFMKQDDVGKDKHTEYSLDFTKWVPISLAGIKKISNIVDRQNIRLTEQDGKIAKLEALVNQLLEAKQVDGQPTEA